MVSLSPVLRVVYLHFAKNDAKSSQIYFKIVICKIEFISGGKDH